MESNNKSPNLLYYIYFDSVLNPGSSVNLTSVVVVIVVIIFVIKVVASLIVIAIIDEINGNLKISQYYSITYTFTKHGFFNLRKYRPPLSLY